MGLEALESSCMDIVWEVTDPTPTQGQDMLSRTKDHTEKLNWESSNQKHESADGTERKS